MSKKFVMKVQKAMHVKKFITMCLVFKTNRFLTHHIILRRGKNQEDQPLTFSQLRSKPFNLRIASILLKLMPYAPDSTRTLNFSGFDMYRLYISFLVSSEIGGAGLKEGFIGNGWVEVLEVQYRNVGKTAYMITSKPIRPMTIVVRIFVLQARAREPFRSFVTDSASI